jgi:hypothetical protein
LAQVVVVVDMPELDFHAEYGGAQPVLFCVYLKRRKMVMV